ncbi:MAG: enoyl-CoA hydratase [Beijerinckiaceae bacterium]|nr:enoyl-CoA hydratase [Beijerinckiaceae bacterium]
MKTSEVRVDVDGSIGWVTFANPARRNAVTLSMWRAVPEIFAELKTDPCVGVVVVRGDGEEAFVSGADISEFADSRATADAALDYEAAGSAALRSIQAFEKPTIAMISGHCVGGGVALALACDLRFAAVNARFSIPAARLGLGYDLDAVSRLVQAVGPSRAKDVLFSARRLDAAEALAIGLVDRMLAVGALESTVREYAETVASNASLTIKASKLSVDASFPPDAHKVEQARAAIAACFASADYKEGWTAFLEKRAPAFRGV